MAWLETHHGTVLTSQLKLQQDPAYIDLTVRLQGGEVRTSRSLVASLSPAFERMLATDLKERNEGVLTLKRVCTEDWHCILSFYTSANNLVTAENVEDILPIAHKYEMQDLEKYCGQLLVDTLTSANCCYRLSLSKEHQPSVSQEIFDFIKKNFAIVSESEYFLCLSKEDLMHLLKSGGIVTSEKILCESLLKWLSSNEVDEESSVEILSQLKLDHLSWEFLSQELLYHDQLLKSARIRQFVAEKTEKTGVSHGLSNDDVMRTWYPRGKVIIGHDGRHFHAFHIHREGNRWIELPKVDCKDYFAVHMVDDTIFITGGEPAERSTYKFHTRTRTWTQGPDLQQGRAAHGMTSVGSSLFVVGGCSSGWELTSIEKHDIGSNQWRKVADLPYAVSMSGVAAVGDVIIVANCFSGDILIQTFNVRTLTTFLITHRHCAMQRVRGASLSGFAVFLGEDGALVRVSLSDSKVTEISRVRLSGFERRRFFGPSVEDDHLLCFGGGPDLEKHTQLDRYSLRGEHEDRNDLPELPVALKVYGAFRTCVLNE